MKIKSILIKPFGKYVAKQVRKMSKTAEVDQKAILNMLISKAKNTKFGKDHNFDKISDYESFKANVPIRDYEKLRVYFDAVANGESNIVWPGRPKYFAKTSGTTSGVKYIPITHDSVGNHVNTAKGSVMSYMTMKNDFSMMDGKLMFLSGSPELETKNGIPTGRLSGIVNHEIPQWIKGNQKPSYLTNCIEDWEEKVEKVVDETKNVDMRCIGGIPPWVQMYFERLLEKTGKNNVLEVFPNFSLFIYGGVNYEPYRAKIESLIGKKIDTLEYYPASEGFFAFQDNYKDNGLLMVTNDGIFFEFVPVHEIHNENPTRLQLHEVELNTDYALIVNSNAGLWGYNTGDCVRFVSKEPYKVRVSGRVKHYISAFGEHVIGKEVDEAMKIATQELGCNVVEFTVAPQVNPDSGLPYHEWFVEFDNIPADTQDLAKLLDANMVKQNIYYQDLIDGSILQPLKVTVLKKGAFIEFMKRRGKLGGQNKVPRLTNDRKIADELQDFVVR